MAQEQKETELGSAIRKEDITLSEIESVKEAVSTLTASTTEQEREELEELKVDFEEFKEVNKLGYLFPSHQNHLGYQRTSGF